MAIMSAGKLHLQTIEEISVFYCITIVNKLVDQFDTCICIEYFLSLISYVS